MNQILDQQFSFTLSGVTLLLFGAAVLIVAAVGIFLYARRGHKVKYGYGTPKYGFLGKPLYNLFAVMIMLGAIGAAGYGIYQDQTFEIKANKTLTAEVSDTVLNTSNGKSQIKFSVVPKVDALDWGNPGDKFDVYWNVNGPENFTQVEQARTISSTSGFTHNLKPGNYKITVLIIFQDSAYTFTKNATF